MRSGSSFNEAKKVGWNVLDCLMGLNYLATTTLIGDTARMRLSSFRTKKI